jgi:SAM-dependent methyltransferase
VWDRFAVSSEPGPGGEDLTGQIGDEVTPEGAFSAVQSGYEAVYEALPRGATFARIWRENAYDGDFPSGFEHIGFLTSSEAERLVELLGVPAGGVLVDLACGAGGPGLWVASRSGASLIGVDPAPAGLAAARRRAAAVGLGDRASFQVGTFEQTGLSDGSADAVMTIEAFQYAPDKTAALAEFARVVKPSGRLGIVCFEVAAAKVAGLPVLGVDPVSDYGPLLERAGFEVEVYEETPGWADRVYSTFGALVDASDALNAEMGAEAAGGVLAEAMLTVATQPYPRRVLIVARGT